MDARKEIMSSPRRNTVTVVTMCAGLALTMLAALIAYGGHGLDNPIAAHVLAGYPHLDPAQIAAATAEYQWMLGVIGALGLAAWILCIALVATRHVAAARWVATGAFVSGAVIALLELSVRDTSGDTGLPILLGLLGAFPLVAGLLALILLWTDRSRPTVQLPH